MQKAEVFVKCNSSGYITAVDGGNTLANIKDFSQWVKIDEGQGNCYTNCQRHYFPETLMTMGGAYRYKLDDGKPVECSAEEIAVQEEANKPAPAPVEVSVWDELDAAYQEGVDSV